MNLVGGACVKQYLLMAGTREGRRESRGKVLIISYKLNQTYHLHQKLEFPLLKRQIKIQLFISVEQNIEIV